ncbi:unnamed protein product [Sympodiomycopsis kandeliae]
MTPILPLELLDLIADFVVAEEDDDGQRWLTRRCDPVSGSRTWKPLRALSQVNRFLRRRAMAAMWRDIRLRPTNEETDNLVQLIQELMLEGDITARDFVQTIDIHIPQNYSVDSHQLEETFSSDQYRHNELIHNNTDDDDEKPIPIMADWARGLGYALTLCSHLQIVRWGGWIVVDPAILYQLSLCHNLTELCIDVGIVEVESVYFGWRSWTNFKPPPLDYNRCLPNLKNIELKSDIHDRQCDLCWDDRWRMRHLQKGAEESFIDRLIAYRIFKHLKVGRDFFLCNKFMIPLHAHIDRLSWSGEMGAYIQSGIHPGLSQQDYPGPAVAHWHWEKRHFYTAASFGKILRENIATTTAEEQLRTEQDVARDVEALVLSHPALAPFKRSFAHRESQCTVWNPFSKTLSPTLAQRVAQVLLAKAREKLPCQRRIEE